MTVAEETMETRTMTLGALVEAMLSVAKAPIDARVRALAVTGVSADSAP